ncbi:MAG: M3 family metallopeptidase [Rhodospirillales bacterium]|nr:M3 family metallopeptidase [Rhodospirillales bacterium]MCB9980009.1 M3 family metallopeptidase [Rhodospirillales bacterium]
MTNPLLTVSPLPNHAPPFDKIKEEHFLPAIEDAIKKARANIEEIKANPDAPTFENTIVALETSSELLDTASSVFYNQLSANGTDGLQELAEKIGPLSSAFSNDILMDAPLFQRVKAVWEQRDTLDLTAEQDTVLDNCYQGFARNGALLDEAGQSRLREISERLSVLSPKFANNATKSAELFEMVLESEDDLAGLPDSAKAMAAHMAEEKGLQGKWLFTLDFPSVIPFLQYSDRRDLREKIWRAFSSRGYAPHGEHEYDNRAILLEIVALRDERAKLLGFKNHAEYVLSRRMAETPAAVQDFLTRLKGVYKPAAQKDVQHLQDFAKEAGCQGDLMQWDLSYYSEKLKHKLYDFSEEDLRPYFPLQKVLDGTFAHFSKLFGLKFTDATGKYPVWHEDVHAYDVTDQDSGRFIGTFYADFFPRTGKKQGAWMTAYRSQGLFGGKVERPVAAIVCNFTKPTKDAPSLLTHGEVTTLFHEMGHAVHGLLSDVTYQSVAGTSVKWDFVELPSQVQENWCFETETLALISGHYQTGESIPQALVDKLRAAKNFMAGWGGLRQVSLGTLDMAWHTTDPKEIKSVEDFEDRATAETTLFPRRGGPTSCSFSHLFAGGYAAGYYSYKWAEVLDADAFALFREKGLYNQTVATRYKTEVLSKGGTEAPALLYERFRGHAPDPDELLRREGLL